MPATLFDRNIVGNAEEVLDFIGNILDSSTEYSIVITDLGGDVLLWNGGARRLYGYEPEEVIGKANTAILHTPEDVEAGIPRAILDGALRDGKWEGMLKRVRKNGQQFTARMFVTPCRDVAGRATGFLLVSKDMSAENRLTEQLKATQFDTRSLTVSNLDALLTTDSLGIITEVNHQMETLIGCSRNELIGAPFKTCFTDPQRAEEGIRRVLREEKVTNYELTARAKDGRMTVVSCNASIFRDAAGQLQGVFAAARDITERKRIEQTLREKTVELEAASLAKDRFLASMSHELRTPLNAVIGFTGTLLMRLPGPLNADQEWQLRTIQSNAKHLLSLINDLLDLAKIESGKVELRFEPVDCRQVLDEVAKALRPLAEAKGLTLSVTGPDAGPIIRTDSRALTQILLNLANNGIRFTERGRVDLELCQCQANGPLRTEFRVSDTGVGIQREDQVKLFQAFEQMAIADGRRHEGTGLGLYLSQKLANLLGSQIEFRSEFGAGSTFTLVLFDKEQG